MSIVVILLHIIIIYVLVYVLAMSYLLISKNMSAPMKQLLPTTQCNTMGERSINHIIDTSSVERREGKASIQYLIN